MASVLTAYRVVGIDSCRGQSARDGFGLWAPRVPCIRTACAEKYKCGVQFRGARLYPEVPELSPALQARASRVAVVSSRRAVRSVPAFIKYEILIFYISLLIIRIVPD